MKLFGAIRRLTTRSDPVEAASPSCSDDTDIDATSRLIMTEGVAGRILMARRLAAAEFDAMDESVPVSGDALEEAIGYGPAQAMVEERETASADR
jgi:hypothetical protein